MRTFILLFLSVTFSSCGLFENKVVYEFTEIDGNATGNRTVDSLQKLCIKAQETGDYSKFKDLCYSIHKLDSNLTQINTGLSFILFMEDNPEKSLYYVNKSIRLGGDNLYNDNSALKAMIFSELNNLDSADFYFSKMYSNKKNDGADIGSLLLCMDKYEHIEKIPRYTEIAYKYYPNNPQIIYYKGIAEIKNENYKIAIDLFTKLENQTTSNAEVYFFKGYCYKKLNEFDLALSCIEKSVFIDSINPRYINARGIAKEKLKDYKGAAYDYRNSISKGDTTAIRFYRNLTKLNK